MKTNREVMQMALFALQYITDPHSVRPTAAEAIAALTEALALPDAEPVGYWLTKAAKFVLTDDPDFWLDMDDLVNKAVPLYTAPPIPEKLTDDEVHAIYTTVWHLRASVFARAIEAAIHAKIGVRT